MMVFGIFLILFVGFTLIQRRQYLAILLGLLVLSNGINLVLFFGSSPELGWFAFVGNDPATTGFNDPTPQALVLTAIVIGFALIGFITALIKSAIDELGGYDTLHLTEEDVHE